jgi:hypothetical protein
VCEPLGKRNLDGGHILTPEEVIRVRASANIDDGVLAETLQPRIVPAAAQVVALAQMRGACQPAGLYLAGCIRSGVDRHHLPVTLVIIDAVE